MRPLACIVGEPTGMVPALAHKGVYRWRCCVKGQAAHSSLTPQAVNAIEVGARVIGKLADMSERWRDHEPRYDGFDVPYSTGASASSTAASPTTWCRRTAASTTSSATCRTPTSRRCSARSRPTPQQLEPPMHAIDARGRHPLRDDQRDAGVPGPARRSGGAAGPAPGRARRRPWSRSAPRPACSSAPASRPWCAAPATSRRRTRPTSTCRWRSSPRPSASCKGSPTPGCGRRCRRAEGVGRLVRHRFSECACHVRSDGSASAGWARRWSSA